MQQLDLIVKAPRRARMHHAKARADFGIERAANATENQHDGWCERAVDELRRFALGQSGMFTIELARLAFESKLPPPNDLRSWGQVTRMAVSRGFIERVPGMYFAAASSNGSEKPCYRRGTKA